MPSYGRFTGEPDELQLARYFHLDEADKEFIGKSRGDHNRLGIALQIGCVRFLGTFLTDMNHIPSGVRHFTARQLGIRDITVLAEYGQRENTRREHALFAPVCIPAPPVWPVAPPSARTAQATPGFHCSRGLPGFLPPVCPAAAPVQPEIPRRARPRSLPAAASPPGCGAALSPARRSVGRWS